MMFMTAKVDYKKILLICAVCFVLILGAITIFGGGKAQTTSAPASQNDQRIAFLQGFGWQVKSTPKESGAVRIPEKTSELFDRYNALQMSQGYNLTQYAGKKALRFVYEITNYPGATEPVYATLLIYKGKVIGGDVTNTSQGGKVHGFDMPKVSTPPAVPQATTPSILPSLPNTTEDAQGFARTILP